MLQIEGIKKIYKTGSLVQEALKGVSLSLRDNEFVAVLGQSGSGKTTLLNIIGGLDRYNAGDLIIDGISTKKYSDRDWDSYRNHSVGFVFQSYNLIPHQTILKNVELALTISGVSARDRAARAKEALEKVGLGEHIHKKPSQLSGGQMQRVAIARALVNDPKILLADEPTGALDSDTSLQVMDLLKEVAEDRLVVMVTHNPELAEQYATRIVTLKDGQITSDSDPYAPEAQETVHKNMGKASMSLLTSLALSFNNLWTKKARTILVSFAGSIGIIGIALILSLSNGANTYIRNVEEDSLQDYPLKITDTNLSIASMITARQNTEAENANMAEDKKSVGEWNAITSMLSGMTTNDLKSLKAYFESRDCDINSYVQAIEYSYNVTPRIYKVNGDSYRQVNPSTVFNALGFSSENSATNGLYSSFTNTDTFFELPENQTISQKNYTLKAGKWPEGSNECMVTLTSSGKISDMTLYVLGLKDPKELDKLVSSFAEGKESAAVASGRRYGYDEILGTEFSLLPTTSFYTYDKKYGVWTDHSSDQKYVKNLLKNAETLRVVGIAQPSGNGSQTPKIGIGYTASLTAHMMETAGKTEIVKAQVNDPDTNVFTGKRFDDENKNSKKPDMSELFAVDKDKIKDLFKTDSMDLSKLDLSTLDLSSLDLSDMDMSAVLSADDLSGLMPALDDQTIASLLSGVRLNLTEETLRSLFGDIVKGYQEAVRDDKRTDISALSSSFAAYLQTDGARELLRNGLQTALSGKAGDMITTEDVAAIAEGYITGYAAWLTANGYEAGDYSHVSDYAASPEAAAILGSGMATLREKLASLTLTEEEIRALLTSLTDGYEQYAEQEQLPTLSYLLSSFGSYLATEEAQGLITKTVAASVDTSALQNSVSQYSEVISQQMGAVMQKIFASAGTQIASMLQSNMAQLTSGLSENLLSGFSFNTDALADVFKTQMTAEELKDLMTSLFSSEKTTYDSNLKKLGYAEPAKPSAITIYPLDFDSKNRVKEIIGAYNAQMEAAGNEEKVIEYTDLVDALMGSVTTIIDAISYILIAFVAISLIVSSIMIGVITYISVLERRKEIGILRAIGASKHNISTVFNAETFIIGALAGVIGIVISELIILIANPILHSLTGQDNINAILPPAAALILIVLSVILTLIGGIIPSRKAAKSDPVTALRSE